jgi:CheY-like chemotaxis protein
MPGELFAGGPPPVLIGRYPMLESIGEGGMGVVWRSFDLEEPAAIKFLRRDLLVVYIEDHPANIAFMTELLADIARIELLTAPNAELGVELVRDRRPRAVILDINLPGMSGIDALRLLRSWPETRDIPVIALSAAAMDHDVRRAQSEGFYRYLTKPVRVDELIAVLEDLLLGPHALRGASR